MKKRLQNYLSFCSKWDLSLFTEEEKHRLAADLLIQIGFFQHERLIHLIVTLTVALLCVISVFVFLIWQSVGVAFLAVGLLLLLIPYIIHYYFLENGVQQLYQYYDQLHHELK
jgi:hypothetical protein